MNLFFETEARDLQYKEKSPKTSNTKYTEIDSEDMAYIIAILEEFVNHIELNKEKNFVQREFYHLIFTVERKTLPKPRKEHRRYNTYETFIRGIVGNFRNGSRDLSTKVFKDVIETTNLAVDYFQNYHPDHLANITAYKLIPVKI